MERKIGEVFEFEGKKIEVKAASNGCDGCFLKEKFCIDSADLVGKCGAGDRTDGKNVIFVEVQEQPQGQAEPQKLNLCEILKDCPRGESFWSPLLGDVKFHDISPNRNFIYIYLENGEAWVINADGTMSICGVTSPEIMLYPSREQRNWTKVKYKKKKKRFDPKTLKPFDRVLVRYEDNDWCCSFFSHHKDVIDSYPIHACVYCIPYNDDTKHLVGTTDEAPDFYRYWED